MVVAGAVVVVGVVVVVVVEVVVEVVVVVDGTVTKTVSEVSCSIVGRGPEAPEPVGSSPGEPTVGSRLLATEVAGSIRPASCDSGPSLEQAPTNIPSARRHVNARRPRSSGLVVTGRL